MSVKTESQKAQNYVEQLTAESPLLSAENHPLFEQFVGNGLARHDPVARRRTFISPLAGGLVRSVIINSFTAHGRSMLSTASDWKFSPSGRIVIHIGEDQYDGQKPTGAWMRSTFQYDPRSLEPLDWMHEGISDGDITEEFCSVAVPELENWGVKVKAIGRQATNGSVELTAWPNYEYNVNYQLSVLE